MPVSFIIFLVFLGLGCLGFMGSRVPSDEGEQRGGRLASWFLMGIAALFAIISSITIVPANEVGIITNFGAWSGTQASGPGLTAPWSSLDTFGTRNQKSVRDEAEGNGSCVRVSFVGGSQGCADMTTLYSIDEANAKRLWDQWKDFTKLNGDLVERQTDDAANTVYAKYTPLEARTTKRAELSKLLNDELGKRLGDAGVRLESVTLGDLHLPAQAQQNLDDLANADNRLEVAKKGEEEAKAKSREADARLKSLTPQELMLQCFSAAREIKPTIFDCTGVGAGIDVNVPPK